MYLPRSCVSLPSSDVKDRTPSPAVPYIVSLRNSRRRPPSRLYWTLESRPGAFLTGERERARRLFSSGARSTVWCAHRPSAAHVQPGRTPAAAPLSVASETGSTARSGAEFKRTAVFRSEATAYPGAKSAPDA